MGEPDRALAGDGFLDRVRTFFASGDDKGVREQVAAFLQSNAIPFAGTGDLFRGLCLDELKALRKSGRLHDGDLWKRAVVGADLAAQGMPRFERYLSPADAELIRAYVARQTAMLYEEEQAPRPQGVK